VSTERDRLVTHLGARAPAKPLTKPSQTEQSRQRRGFGRLTLRLPLATLAQLDAIAADVGHSRTAVINSLILLTDQARPQNGQR